MKNNNHSSNNDYLVSMMQKMMEQSAKERTNSARWDLATLMLIYAFIIIVVFLDLNEFKAVHLTIASVAGLVVIVLMRAVRERDLARREARNLKSIFTPLPDQEEVVKPAISPGENSVLTTRELEILSHVVQGQSDKEIAVNLKLSQYTVRNHLRNIYQKLDVKDRTAAAVQALNFGWIKVNSVSPDAGRLKQ
jgi:DNA-binding CsgD family transcriptional regulator